MSRCFLKITAIVSCKQSNQPVTFHRCVSSRYHTAQDWFSKFARRFNVGLKKERPKDEIAKKSLFNLIRSQAAATANYYDNLNTLDISMVDTCSRHLYPGHLCGSVLRGRVQFHDNFHTGEDWVAGSSKVAQFCQDPDPPYLATLEEIEFRYKPKRIKGLDFSGTDINLTGLLSLEGMLDDIQVALFNNCHLFDDQCLAVISRVFGRTLKELDISYCPKVTPDGLWSIHTQHLSSHLQKLTMNGMPHLVNSKQLYQLDQTVPFLKIFV